MTPKQRAALERDTLLWPEVIAESVAERVGSALGYGFNHRATSVAQ